MVKISVCFITWRLSSLLVKGTTKWVTKFPELLALQIVLLPLTLITDSQSGILGKAGLYISLRYGSLNAKCMPAYVYRTEIVKSDVFKGNSAWPFHVMAYSKVKPSTSLLWATRVRLQRVPLSLQLAIRVSQPTYETATNARVKSQGWQCTQLQWLLCVHKFTMKAASRMSISVATLQHKNLASTACICQFH